MKHPMTSFRRAYVVSLVAFGFLAIGGVMMVLSGQGSDAGFGMAILVAFGAALVPVFIKGGIAGRPRLALGIASTLTMVFGLMLLWAFLDFVRSRGGEGANGEGSPLEMIVAMVFLALFFFCPWLLTCIRGLAVVRGQSRASEEAVASRSVETD